MRPRPAATLFGDGGIGLAGSNLSIVNSGTISGGFSGEAGLDWRIS